MTLAFAPAFGNAGRAAGGPLEKTEIRGRGGATQVTFSELSEDLDYLAPLQPTWVGSTWASRSSVIGVTVNAILEALEPHLMRWKATAVS